MIYTNDEFMEIFVRQAIEVDGVRDINVVFGEQIDPLEGFSPSRLCYITNKSGNWLIETAVNYLPGSRDDAGFYPSLCLDNFGNPYIPYTYIRRVPTGSVSYAKLFYVIGIDFDNWVYEVVAEGDDGYYETDGIKLKKQNKIKFSKLSIVY